MGGQARVAEGPRQEGAAASPEISKDRQRETLPAGVSVPGHTDALLGLSLETNLSFFSTGNWKSPVTSDGRGGRSREPPVPSALCPLNPDGLILRLQPPSCLALPTWPQPHRHHRDSCARLMKPSAHLAKTEGGQGSLISSWQRRQGELARKPLHCCLNMLSRLLSWPSTVTPGVLPGAEPGLEGRPEGHCMESAPRRGAVGLEEAPRNPWSHAEHGARMFPRKGWSVEQPNSRRPASVMTPKCPRATQDTV